MNRYQPVWQTETVHLIPADRAGHRVIDGERVCQAIEALGDPDSVRTRAQYFALLADPTRLPLLPCIGRAGRTALSALAVAPGLHDTTISQPLRSLRAAQVASSERDGSV